ncbi:MAG: type II secretion system protein [Planctomycetota bacterium]
MHRSSSRRAFTLIELIAVVVILAVLSGIAIPTYFDYSARAQTAAVQGALGGVRTGIASFYANAATNGNPLYPTLQQLTEQGTVMQEPLPPNPYNGLNNVIAATQAEADARTTSATAAGWRYFVNNAATPPVAVFYANSTEATRVNDAAGAAINANDL